MKYVVVIKMTINESRRTDQREFSEFEEALAYANKTAEAMNTIYMMDWFEVSIQGG